jgi:hypothetical protein
VSEYRRAATGVCRTLTCSGDLSTPFAIETLTKVDEVDEVF